MEPGIAYFKFIVIEFPLFSSPREVKFCILFMLLMILVLIGNKVSLNQEVTVNSQL